MKKAINTNTLKSDIVMLKMRLEELGIEDKTIMMIVKDMEKEIAKS